MANASADTPGRVGTVVRALVPLAGLVLVVAVLAHLWRPEVEAAATRFIAWAGLPGLFIGTLLADGLHVPPPPQFYLLAVAGAGMDPAPAMGVITVASVLGGLFSHGLGRALGGRPLVRAWADRSLGRLAPLFHRYGRFTVVVAALTPVPYSSFCLASGVFRMERNLVAAFIGLRVPRLMVYWFLIQWGWSLG